MKENGFRENSIELLKEDISAENRTTLIQKYRKVRSFSIELCKPLVTEDYVIQSMPDVSPTKWHLAHTSWFFEAFVLRKSVPDYISLHPQYNFLFNSYYVLVGERWTRAMRGLLSRPTVSEVFKYRDYIDEKMVEFLENSGEEIYTSLAPVVEIGIHHEQQHQELILTDIKHVFSINPLTPVYFKKETEEKSEIPELNWISFKEGVHEIGFEGRGFSYDNEGPKHKEYLESFLLSSRLITNGEYIEFIEDKAYQKPELWLSDGYAAAENEKWYGPLYWKKENGRWQNFTLNGKREVNPDEPLCHISYYEADAYARWAGARLPSEAEWEVAADNISAGGNFADNKNFHPVPLKNPNGGLQQMYGDVWEWTRSSYSPYPGYKTLPGALGEYNGKFMSNQMVLRGGSCATSLSHIRKTYRNFFPPNARWQFMGIRLAKDI
ncbi:MAG TPA: ergothioneine biosynthesis protein EgtB [Ignavibacteriaceae bacterium]|nr:ergothioneine biosynthesis protein EgtB [Ignavibacteriaceae bacterium]